MLWINFFDGQQAAWQCFSIMCQIAAVKFTNLRRYRTKIELRTLLLLLMYTN